MRPLLNLKLKENYAKRNEKHNKPIKALMTIDCVTKNAKFSVKTPETSRSTTIPNVSQSSADKRNK